ncbi:MAG: NADPH:quinone reductase [Acidobacteriaceae bacterium]|nr:NADPH:quinone reductase [Acidobacteriaceae bacterium]
MRAAWYEKQGTASEVLIIGEMPDPHPSAGEVRIRVAASGINPGDVKKRQDSFSYGMPYPRVIPHSDGAGQVDEVGEGVSSEWLGQPVWCYGAQSYRPFGTAAEFTVVPVDQIARLPEGVSMDQGACLGIPGITAHRAVHVGNLRSGQTVLIQGAAGAVGLCAVQLARRAGAYVIGAVRSSSDEASARKAGAHDVVLVDAKLVQTVKSIAPKGVDHIVEVAFAANISADVELLNMGGSVATYATDNASPTIPFWPMVFKNIRLFFLGSDDFPRDAKMRAAEDLNAVLEAGWSGFEIAERVPLSEISRAHDLVEHPVRSGRIVVIVT